MRIERDRHYQTRRGDKVRVICVDGPGDCPVIGLMGVLLCRWDSGGHYHSYRCQDSLDIIAEWTDPPPEWPDGMPAWANYITEDEMHCQEWWDDRPGAMDNEAMQGEWDAPCGAIMGWVPGDYRVTFPDHLHWTERIISRPGVDEEQA